MIGPLASHDDIQAPQRRRFIKAACGLLVPATLAPELARAQQVQQMRPGVGPAIPKWPQPGQTRQIWLRRPVTNETVVARYFENGAVRMDDYLRACYILRDVRAKIVAHIDIELMDLIFAIQSWLTAWGIDIPMEIVSGYRSPKTNGSTEGAALNSMHLYGRAADISMKGIPPDYLGRLASLFQIGGVGFYRTKHLTHIDTGRVRYWTH